MSSSYEEAAPGICDGQLDEELAFSVSIQPVQPGSGFNEYGVKEYDDGSIDVAFNAMEPGLRKGIRVTETFLRRVAGNFSESLPLQMDHSRSQRANVGVVKEVEFRSPFLRVLGHVPNTGSSVRSDVIADFTHEPPAISDGSVGFGMNYEMKRNDDDELEFVDATMQEFSLTPFPAGYDDGGLAPAFAEAVEAAGLFDEPASDTTPIGTSRVKARSYATIRDI